MRWPAPLRRPPPRPLVNRTGDRPPSAAVEHASPGLAALFGALDPDLDHHVLDLGAASGASLGVYGGFARHVRFADLLAVPAGTAPSGGAGTAVTAFAAVLAEESIAFTVIVAWDRLDYLEPDARRALVAELAGHSSAGAQLYAVIAETATILCEPPAFVLLDTDRLVVRAATTATRPHRRLAPAEVERAFHPFVVERSFVLRNGTREYVAALV